MNGIDLYEEENACSKPHPLHSPTQRTSSQRGVCPPGAFEAYACDAAFPLSSHRLSERDCVQPWGMRLRSHTAPSSPPVRSLSWVPCGCWGQQSCLPPASCEEQGGMPMRSVKPQVRHIKSQWISVSDSVHLFLIKKSYCPITVPFGGFIIIYLLNKSPADGYYVASVFTVKNSAAVGTCACAPVCRLV